MKLIVRKLTNLLIRIIPPPLMRYLLKSIWYQPGLQDSVRMHVQPYRYDSAIPTRLDVDVERLKLKRHLPGVCWDEQKFLAVARALASYAGELSHIPTERTGDGEFWFRNGAYGDGDATTLYAMIRHYKPGRIIEVGCGFSSRVIALACAKNRAEGHAVDCLHIEPYPSPNLLVEKLPGRLLVEKIENIPLETFKNLQAGDFLFIDTSHVIKTQNDCCFEYLEVIPSLRPGVVVHVHDIFTPYDYPEDWLFQCLFPFNEQYALECLITDNPKIEILLPVFFLWKDYPEEFRQMLPFRSGTSERPGAFWFGIREVASRAPSDRVNSTDDVPPTGSGRIPRTNQR